MRTVYKESSARTNKLKCSDCDNPISIGEDVIFELDPYSRKPMVNVYCSCCKGEYEEDVEHDYADHCQD